MGGGGGGGGGAGGMAKMRCYQMQGLRGQSVF